MRNLPRYIITSVSQVREERTRSGVDRTVPSRGVVLSLASKVFAHGAQPNHTSLSVLLQLAAAPRPGRPRKTPCIGRIFCGEPLHIPDQVRDRLSPENAPSLHRDIDLDHEIVFL